jgi:mycothiol synthase
VLLLSRMPEQSAMEVVYMGLRAACRGRGYAAALLSQGVRMARDSTAWRLTLAVDAINTPARELYARFGFRETSRRSALIRLLNPACSSIGGKKSAGS